MSELKKLAAKKQRLADNRIEAVISFLEQDSNPVPAEVLNDLAHILSKAQADQQDALMLTGERLQDLEERILHLSIPNN
tara:strand:+ start:1417 stop:1653 length:237 start_codon:yes stop_codon:yes gene_type:complete